MQPTDIRHLRVPADPALHPDGQHVVVSVTRPLVDEDRYEARLWGAAVAADDPLRPLTHGPSDTRPTWSPDGLLLAFLRTQEGGRPQVHLLSTAGGEPWTLTELPLGVEELVWAPDSRRLALVARVPEEGRYGTDPDVEADAEAPRRVTTLTKVRLDGIGWVLDRPPHVHVVQVGEPGAIGTVRQVTEGEHGHTGVAWSPDGRLLAWIAAHHATRDTDLRADVWVATVDDPDAPPRRVTDTTASPARVAFTDDGASVLFAGVGPFDGPEGIAGRSTSLWRVPTDASRAPERLTDEETVDLAAFGVTSRQPLLVEDDRVVCLREHAGAVQLVAVALADGAVSVLDGGEHVVEGYARAAGTTVVVRSDATSAGEVWVAHEGVDAQCRSDLGRTLAAAAPLAAMEALRATAPDGYPVHGWLLVPPGPGPHPVVLMVHGGPYTQSTWRLFDEAQVAVGAGYAVVLGNPRGSSGFGQAHGRSIVGRMGTDDVADLLALTDAALEDPRLDAERLAVMGGSYGGFMTTWLLGVTDRFRCGISERALNAFDSFRASSDIGPYFAAAYPGDDPEVARAQSPLTHADGIDVPTLVIHAEQDWRCPLEQGQRLYVHLKQRGVETELLVFPGEGHELSRSGRPRHRVQRFEAVLDWLGRYL